MATFKQVANKQNDAFTLPATVMTKTMFANWEMTAQTLGIWAT